MSDHTIDPVQFGQLIGAMRSLEKELTAARGDVAALEQRLGLLEQRYRIGKAGIVGLVLGVGFAIVGVKESLSNLLKALL